MPSQIPYYGMAKFSQSSAVTWAMPAEPLPRSNKQKEAESNLTRGKKNGYMSVKTKRSITRILRCWIDGVEMYRKARSRKHLVKMPYFTFVTLTLSDEQKHNDKEIRRKMVFPFIQKLIRHHNVWHYLFVCEKQSNGRLHIHLLIDSYIPHARLREHWNETQDLHGYIDNYALKFGSRNPNSTDIHKIHLVHNLQSYVIKYMTTDKKDIPLEGRLWGCSNQLRQLRTFTTMIEGDVNKAIYEMSNSSLFKVKKEENYTLYMGPVYLFLKRYHARVFKEVEDKNREQIEGLYLINPEILNTLKVKRPVFSPIEKSESTSLIIKSKKYYQLQIKF